MGGITNEPASPAANFLTIYAKSVAGKWCRRLKARHTSSKRFGRITLWNPTNPRQVFGLVPLVLQQELIRITYYYYSFILTRSRFSITANQY
jgi:hypothetical protein